jgi:uncharacterized membrane protein YfcA
MFRTLWRSTPTSKRSGDPDHILVRPEVPRQDRATHINRMIVSRTNWHGTKETLIIAVPNGGRGSGYVADPRLFRNVMIGVLGLAFLMAEGALLSGQNTPAALSLLAIFTASTVSSIAGFAFSALCGAMLFHLMDSPVHVVQVMIVCSIAIQLLSVTTLWRSIDWHSLPVFLAGGILGVPAGVYLLLHLPTAIYRDIIGVLLIAYGGYLLIRRPTRTLQTGPLWDIFAGFLGGITGGLAGFPGAFVTIWCGLKGWSKEHRRGVYQPFILCMQPVTLIAIYLMRPSSATTTQLDFKTAVFVPAALLGAWLGLRIFRWLSDYQFELAVNALLILSGIGLIL